MSRERLVYRGLRWVLLSLLSDRIIQLFVTFYLARKIAPAEFGQVGVVSVIFVLARTLIEFSIPAALARDKSPTAAKASTLFWLSVTTGLISSGLFFGFAEFIAHFYNYENLSAIVKLLCWQLFLDSLTYVPQGLLEQKMEFKGIAFSRFLAAITGMIVAFTLLSQYANATLLVWKALSESFVYFVALTYISKWRPSFTFSYSEIRKLFRFSGPLTIYNFINYWSRNLDDLLIGKYVGMSALGLYAKAYFLATYPNMFLQGLGRGVLIPSMAKIQDDREKLGNEYLLSIRILGLAVFPVLLGLLILADDVIHLLYGPNWLSAVTTLKILCLVGMVQVTPTGWLYSVTGQTDRMMRLSFLTTAITVVGFIIGVQFGTIESVALSYLAANFVLIWPLAWVPCRMINLSFSRYLLSIFGPLLISVLMATTIYLLKLFTFQTVHPLFRILVFVPVGVLIHWFFVRHFFRQEYIYLLKVIGFKPRASVR